MLKSFSHFVKFSVVLNMVAARVIHVPLGVIYVTLNKKGLFLRVFDQFLTVTTSFLLVVHAIST